MQQRASIASSLVAIATPGFSRAVATQPQGKDELPRAIGSESRGIDALNESNESKVAQSASRDVL